MRFETSLVLAATVHLACAAPFSIDSSIYKGPQPVGPATASLPSGGFPSGTYATRSEGAPFPSEGFPSANKYAASSEGASFPSGAAGFPSGKYPAHHKGHRPTGVPSGFPSGHFSGFPSGFPSGLPHGLPSGRPSGFHSGKPTGYPTDKPTALPTDAPTDLPTHQYSLPVESSVASKRDEPKSFAGKAHGHGGEGHVPSAGFPTAFPTGFPTDLPSGASAGFPSGFPTDRPSGFPTERPTGLASGGFPTERPTGVPSGLHTAPVEHSAVSKRQESSHSSHERHHPSAGFSGHPQGSGSFAFPTATDAPVFAPGASGSAGFPHHGGKGKHHSGGEAGPTNPGGPIIRPSSTDVASAGFSGAPSGVSSDAAAPQMTLPAVHRRDAAQEPSSTSLVPDTPIATWPGFPNPPTKSDISSIINNNKAAATAVSSDVAAATGTTPETHEHGVPTMVADSAEESSTSVSAPTETATGAPRRHQGPVHVAPRDLATDESNALPFDRI